MRTDAEDARGVGWGPLLAGLILLAAVIFAAIIVPSGPQATVPASRLTHLTQRQTAVGWKLPPPPAPDER
jgi:hypothetical protein